MDTKIAMKQLTTYKNEILKLLTSDQMLMRAVANNEEDCLVKPVDSPGDLLYSQIYPYKHVIDETQEEAKTFITMDMAVGAPFATQYYSFDILVFVITHKSLMRIKVGDEYQLRTDYILGKVDSLLTSTTDLGMGTLKLEGSGSSYYGANFPCFYLHFSTVDVSGKTSDILDRFGDD